jgi:hypothetical protein
MAGLNKMSKEEITRYYLKIISLLADECAAWLNEQK